MSYTEKEMQEWEDSLKSGKPPPQVTDRERKRIENLDSGVGIFTLVLIYIIYTLFNGFTFVILLAAIIYSVANIYGYLLNHTGGK